MKQPVGVILAGGAARRMGGGQKALVALAGRPLATHVADRLAPQVAALALNGPADGSLDTLGLPVLPDTLPDQPGPLAGVLAAMLWARSQGATHVVTSACDTPFLPADLVPRLLLAAETSGHPIAMAASGTPERLHPTTALWDVALAGALTGALMRGERKVALWAQDQGMAQVTFPAPGLDPFFNVNTADDLAAAEALLT